MRITRATLRLVSFLVPRAKRPRWLEEWRAEIRHGGWRMLPGAVPDAWTLREFARREARLARRGGGLLHALDQDLRYALRGLARSPGFATGVILSLAVGIGANTAAFSFINAAVFRPYPHVQRQDELVRLSVAEARDRGLATTTTFDDFRTLSERVTTVAALAGSVDTTFAVRREGPAIAIPGVIVSAGYFDVLGVAPARGRFFVSAEDGAPGAHPVAVISDDLWQRLFERHPSALGATISVNGTPLHVVGIAPAGFMGARKGDRRPDLWVPLSMGHLALRGADGRPAAVENARNTLLTVIGRRRADVSFDAVKAEAAAVGRRLADERSNDGLTVTATRVWLNDPGKMAPAIVGFMAVPMLVLAIACVNAANLLFARAHRRGREWAVRAALGASRWRVVRQVLCESLILGSMSALAGLLLTRWGLTLVAREVPFPMPLDQRVLGFTLVLTVLTAVAFSLWPALRVTSAAARPTSFTTTGHQPAARSRLRFGLVAVQAALSLGLLTTGAQFAKTVAAASDDVPIPFPERLVLASFNVDPLGLDPHAAEAFFERLERRVRQIPGVRSASFSEPGLLTGSISSAMLARSWPTGQEPPDGMQIAVPVSPGFFENVGVPLVQGRAFTNAAADSDTAVVNTTFAASVLGGHPLGRTIRVAPAGTADAEAREATVIGVVGGILRRTGEEPPIVYYTGRARTARTLSIRLDDSGAFTAAALHAAAEEVNAGVPMSNVATLREVRARNPEAAFLTRGVLVLGALALALAAGGLYSVVAFAVSTRRQELGVRLSLGASPEAIVRLVLRQGLAPAIIGAVLGAAGAAAAGALVKSRLFGADGPDPVAFGAAALLMLAVMIIASWVPARQAGRIDPLSVLRTE